MVEMVENMIRLTMCGVDVFMIYSFFDSMFTNQKKKTSLWIFFSIATIGIWITNFLRNPWINLLVVPFWYYFFIKVVFKVSLQKSIVYTAIYFIIFACGRELAFEMIYRLLQEVCPEMSKTIFSPDRVVFLIVEVAFSFCLLLYIEKYTRKLEGVGEIEGDWYLLIMPVTSILILFCFACIDFPSEIILQMLFCIGGFLLYFSNAVIFVILANYTVNMNKIKMSELSILKRDLDNVNFENIQKANSAYRKYMHDIHQYFFQIRNLAASGKDNLIINIIDEVEGQMKNELQNTIYVGDPILNSILSVCKNKAEEMEIMMSVIAEENVNLGFMQDIDKISIFGNLIDNALEAASKCAFEMRKVEIRLFMGSQYILYFEIRNTWNGRIYREGENFLSSKQDGSNHGLGINIVKELLKKYRGDLDFSEEEEWFVTTLYISNYTD